jgi:energy-coupling factor transporter ATP-binding protein EcfA2
MRLTRIRIERFKNIVDPQTIDIEDDVTCFIGKNEAGKTTILKALHRLNPANGAETTFDLTTEYPRWRLAKDRRGADLDEVFPITAWFAADASDFADIEGMPEETPDGVVCMAQRSYGGQLRIGLECPPGSVITKAASIAGVQPADLDDLITCSTVQDAATRAKALAKELKDGGETARSKTMAGFLAALDDLGPLTTGTITKEIAAAIAARLPRFFYFSSYDILPGECDLNVLAQKVAAGKPLPPDERTVVALLARAGEAPEDFLDDDYDSRKAELQAASSELTQHAFQYWTQNTDLDVIFDAPLEQVNEAPAEYHRILRIELRDGRHGGVETNFSTRSSGFQWFFSFFAAFSQHQDAEEPLIVLLDEPGTSLHGEAQKDFLRFVYEELGAAKQTLYTTHSQYMVDPSRYEKLRAVHDRATRQNPDLGVEISQVSLSADRDTVLPVESALGYSISQHLFIGGGHHLTVEGSSDFIYLQRMTEYLAAQGTSGLDPRLSIIPVGGDSNMPAFVALLGRRLKVSVLIDGEKTSSKLDRLKNAAAANNVPESSIVVCGQVDGVPKNADIEDMFDVEDYLTLFNGAFKRDLTPGDLASTEEPVVRRVTDVVGVYDHALPAHWLTENREAFFASVRPLTVARFVDLFGRLNGTLG